MKAYSMDLRERVMADVDAGMKVVAVAKKFSVSSGWIRKLKRLRRETGSIGPRQQRVSHATKLDADLPRLEALVQSKPDATIKELHEQLAAPVSRATIGRALQRLRYTFKKRLSMPRSNIGPTSKSVALPGV